MRHFIKWLVFLLDIMFVVVVNVHVGSFYICKTFELSLQSLTNVVSHLERQILVHDDIDFDVVFLPCMIGTTLPRR